MAKVQTLGKSSILHSSKPTLQYDKEALERADMLPIWERSISHEIPKLDRKPFYPFASFIGMDFSVQLKLGLDRSRIKEGSQLLHYIPIIRFACKLDRGAMMFPERYNVDVVSLDFFASTEKVTLSVREPLTQDVEVRYLNKSIEQIKNHATRRLFVLGEKSSSMRLEIHSKDSVFTAGFITDAAWVAQQSDAHRKWRTGV